MSLDECVVAIESRYGSGSPEHRAVQEKIVHLRKGGATVGQILNLVYGAYLMPRKVWC